MKRKLLVLFLILSMVIPVVQMEPAYALAPFWETVTDFSYAADIVGISAKGPTSTFVVPTKNQDGSVNGITDTAPGRFVINNVGTTNRDVSRDRTMFVANYDKGVLGLGAYDPQNYQYAFICYGVYASQSGGGGFTTLSPADSSQHNVAWGRYEDEVLTNYVQTGYSYSSNNVFGMPEAPVDVIYTIKERGDLAFSTKFHTDSAKMRIKVIRRLWPKPSTMTLTTPPNQIVNNSIVMSGSVSDPNITEELTPYYKIDGGAPVALGGLVVQSPPSQNMAFPNKTIDLSGVAEGSHTLTAWCGDNNAQKSPETVIPFKIDRSNPVISSSVLSSDATSLTGTVTASDAVAGLAGVPYMYAIQGVAQTGWLASNVFTQTNLSPNNSYTVKFDVQDAVAHVATDSKSIYTKAQVPLITVDQAKSDSLRATLSDKNPDGTQYQILVNGTNYVTPEGTLTTSPVWVPMTKSGGSKAIVIKGLNPSTVYTITSKTRNAVNIETVLSSPVSGTTLIAPPQVPTNITATRTATAITLNWTPVPTATGYTVEFDGSPIDVGTKTTYTTPTTPALNPNTPHTYRVFGKNAGGNGTASTLTTLSTLPLPPTTPTNIVIHPESTSISITWDNVPSATLYEIEVNGTVVPGTPKTNYPDSGLATNFQRSYRVRSINDGGKSAWSAIYYGTTKAASCPVPSNFAATTTPGSITVSWAPVTNATGYDVKVDNVVIDNNTKTSYLHTNPAAGTHQYQVRSKQGAIVSDWTAVLEAKAVTAGFGAPMVNSTVQDTSITLNWSPVPTATGYDVEVNGIIQNIGANTAFTHTGLSPNKAYTYRVRAKAATDSDWSVPQILTTAFLATPKNLSTTASALSLQMKWDQVPGATAYNVMVDGSIIPVDNVTSVSKGGLSPGTMYRIQVQAKNNLGVSSWSPVLMAQTLGTSSGAVDITGLARKDAITLIWSPRTTGSALEVEVDGISKGTVATTSYTHSGLAAGSKHVYRVRTVTGGTLGSWSTPLTVLTLAATPPVPTNIVASSSMSVIQVSWDAVLGATGYDVEVDGVITDNGTGLAFASTGLAPGSTHKYRVRAENEGGASDWSVLLVKTTEKSDKTYKLSTTLGDEFNLVLPASNIQDLSPYTFTVIYNPLDFDVVDLCGLTSKIDQSTGSIIGTSITVTQFVPGTIVFTKKNSAGAGDQWASVVNSIRFKSKKTGEASISYTITNTSTPAPVQ